MSLVTEIVFISGLFINALLDIKRKQVSVLVILLMAIYIIVYKFYYNLFTFPESLFAMIPGVLLILISFVGNECIGYGDGLLLICFGLYEDIETIYMLCIAAVTLAGIFAMVLVLFCKKNRSYEIPFVPFLILGYGIMKGMV